MKHLLTVIVTLLIILSTITISSSTSTNIDWYTKPSSYKELVEWYKTLEELYPGYIEVFKANELYNTGKVAGGYDLYYVRITNESRGLHKPEVLFLGSPHGDETTGTIGLYWFTNWFLRKALTDEPCKEYSKSWLKWLLDNREIYIEVSHNPYGFDYKQRYDAHGWDLNREADFNGPGSPTGGIWASVNGETLVRFINNHTIRVGCDFHGGARMLLYPWADTHAGVDAISPITGHLYRNVPPDFYFYDASSLRLGSYIGDFGGDLNPSNIGTIHELITYSVRGGICPWAYAADVEAHPYEDIYVRDETHGNYPGARILWISPEISGPKDPLESTFGNDTTLGFGIEVRRFVLHQVDLAQPYIRWISTPSDITVTPGTTITFRWQVNGSLVVDHTFIKWGENPDPINHSSYQTRDHDEYAGRYLGGTGWDNAENGTTHGVIYQENITLTKPGEYYFVATAKVDQIYAKIVHPEIYGEKPYSRLVRERTDPSYHEIINGTDGREEIRGREWWYSPVIHITVRENHPPQPPTLSGRRITKVNQPIIFTISTIDNEGDNVSYYIDWGDGTNTSWLGPYKSGEKIKVSHTWREKGLYLVKIKARDNFKEESQWRNTLILVIKGLNHL
ncbi:MAG TPA: PKD domain-containing protein, partial [Thermoplasmatales archaeon]|nr:PKD domain-containing protein [Thermoplasmatales archaeon]